MSSKGLAKHYASFEATLKKVTETEPGSEQYRELRALGAKAYLEPFAEGVCGDGGALTRFKMKSSFLLAKELREIDSAGLKAYLEGAKKVARNVDHLGSVAYISSLQRRLKKEPLKKIEDDLVSEEYSNES